MRLSRWDWSARSYDGDAFGPLFFGAAYRRRRSAFASLPRYRITPVAVFNYVSSVLEMFMFRPNCFEKELAAQVADLPAKIAAMHVDASRPLPPRAAEMPGGWRFTASRT
jgi:hypothetical protein